jgi:hypothetical protein
VLNVRFGLEAPSAALESCQSAERNVRSRSWPDTAVKTNVVVDGVTTETRRYSIESTRSVELLRARE